jgi:hypothetical protein
VLPSPSVPTYRIALDWSRVPEKIEGQYKGVAAEEQAAVEVAAREAAARVALTAEDEAIFRACCFTSPDFLPRALLKTASSGTLLPPLERNSDMAVEQTPIAGEGAAPARVKAARKHR